MKPLFSTLLFLFVTLLQAQVGIGTTTPAATLDIAGQGDNAAVLDGVIPPRLTGDQLTTKTYTTAQTGAIVYISAAASSPSGQTAKVTQSGYFYYDGSEWLLLGNTSGSFTNDAWRDSSDGSSAQMGDPEIYYSGQVGIGLTDPVRKLHLFGNNSVIRIDSSGGDDAGIYLNSVTSAGVLQGGFLVYGNNDKFGIGYDTDAQGAVTDAFTILQNGNVGIGELLPNYKLEVDGTVRADDFISNTTTYPDYVFEAYNEGRSKLKQDYTFPSLSQVQEFVSEHNHLPGVTGIKHLKRTKEGNYVFNVTETSVQLLEKVEELFLYSIEQEKQLEQYAQRIAELKKQVARLQEEAEK